MEVLGHLERVPFFGYGEARNGPIALYSDVFYANLGLSGLASDHAVWRQELMVR